MSGDLRFFYERDLDRTNLKDFYDSLPSSIKYKFRASLNAVISNTNVLQGYRGPSHMWNGGSGDSHVLHSSHGMQEIKYWWATRKDVNYVPVAGTLIFGLARACEKIGGELEWSSLYFDSKTGQCLSHDKDEAAEELNKIGLRLCKEGKYSDAAEYHNNAYKSCSSGYRNEDKFKSNARKAESKSQESSSNYNTDYNHYEPTPRSFVEPMTRNSNRYSDVDYGVYSTTEEYYNNRRRRDEDWETYENERYVSDLIEQGNELLRRGMCSRAEAIFHHALHVSRVSEHRQMCDNGICAALNEKSAMEFNAQGDYYFAQGDYGGAYAQYQQAFMKSKVHDQRRKYEENYERARVEIGAKDLNCEGDKLFEQGKYSDALDKYREAFDRSKVDHQTYFVNADYKAKSEVDAIKLNSQGDNLFSQGKYNEALNCYRQAYNKSRVGKEKQKYKANMDKAQGEINAQNLNSQGDNLFQQEKYSEAQNKYQEAYNQSQIEKEKNLYAANRDKAKVEVYAKQLNSEGCHLFEQGNYSESEKKFQQAHNMSQVDKHKKRDADNRIIAQREKDALQLYSEGENLLKQRKYSESHKKFQESISKSKVTAQIQKYKAKEDIAKSEIDTIQLNSKGDDLFNQGKYNDALPCYQQAHNTSQVSTEKQIYNANIVKAQTILTNLKMIDTLWKQAWDAENDGCDGAKSLFARILSESRRSLELFPSSSKLKQYETLATLKIEGNEIFDQGLELQRNGITLFEEALELKQRENYESANIKFKQAKMKFLDAQEKFERGKQIDQRFSSCIEFVQEQIKAVTDSIKITEQFMLSQGLHNLHVNVGSDNDAATHSCETAGAEKQNNYSAHI